MADRQGVARAVTAWAVLFGLGAILAIVVADRLDLARGGAAVEWRHPAAAGLGAVALVVAWAGFHLRRQRGVSLGHARVALLAEVRPSLRARLATAPTALRALALVMLAMALARPQAYRIVTRTLDSVDIMIVFDLSKSMEADDLERNRLDAAQRVVRRFIGQRANDRVGLVVFAQQAMLQCPLTLDMAVLDRVVAGLRIGDVPEFGTAIGDGLALGLAQLRRSDAKSKVVILLSDGDSNVATEFQPDAAAAVAKTMGVKVFTMLIGAETASIFGDATVDPETLRAIAKTTGGEFFPAVDQASFEAGFGKVRDQLDTTRRTQREKLPGQELFGVFALAALLLLVLERLLAAAWLRRGP